MSEALKNVFDPQLDLDRCRQCGKLVPNYRLEIWTLTCQECVTRELNKDLEMEDIE